MNAKSHAQDEQAGTVSNPEGLATCDLRLATKSDTRYCRDLTRREAANFYWGFLALPGAQRTAIYALYSFAREVDDHVDLSAQQNLEPVAAGVQHQASGNEQQTTNNEQRTTNNEQRTANGFAYHRRRLEACYAGQATDPVMRVLAEVVVRYGIPQDDLAALIEGVEMDLQVSRFETWDEMRSYCRLVASTIGRMCVHVFGFNDPAALEYADELGIAMQLTNILRDVREDAAMGRIYLPQQELRSFGVPEAALLTGEPIPEWESLARFQIERARRQFADGLRVTACIPRRAAVCVLTMAGIYQRLLEEIARDPYLPLRGRAALSGKDKLAVMLQSWLRAA